MRGIAIAIAITIIAISTAPPLFQRQPASASVCARTAGHCATTRRVERTPASALVLVLRDSALPYTRIHSVGKVPVPVVAQACTHSDLQPRPALTYICMQLLLLDTAPSLQVASPSDPPTPASAPAPPPQPAPGSYCTNPHTCRAAYSTLSTQHSAPSTLSPRHRASPPLLLDRLQPRADQVKNP